MSLNESDTRSKLIDPALYRRGWTEDNIKREHNAARIDIVNGKPIKRNGKIDYIMRFRVHIDTQPIAMAIIEAKAEHLAPNHGLQQARSYADAQRFNVPFVFSSNGHQFVEFDRLTGQTSAPQRMELFPTPDELRTRYEAHVGFKLSDAAASPLLTPYTGGEATQRYYQDAAIRAALEKIARCTVRGEPPRALLSLATGAGKTRIAVNLLKRIADSGQPLKALFVCDRDELRTQASGAFQNLFGSNAAVVSAQDAQTNARVLIATYQTLDIDGADDEQNTASFLSRKYPIDYFTHIVIDECHRSAWGKWSQVLTRNPHAVQIGLTATPRQLRDDGSAEAATDAAISADNLRHFGEPVYEYEIGQGIEDGFLAACEIYQSHISIDGQGVSLADLRARNPVDAITGQPVGDNQLRALYERTDFEAGLLLPDRLKAMCQDLFDQLLATGGPQQKTIIFCVRDRHADDVADTMRNLYTAWCQDTGVEPASHYAFKCTAASGSDGLDDLRGSSQDYFIATTVDLLTTGVDVPALQNVVFFRYVRSPISFYQMVGRGTRIDVETGKLMFRVYDYTNATRLFGEDFFSRRRSPKKLSETGGTYVVDGDEDPFADDTPTTQTPIIRVEGFNVLITPAGHLILTNIDGKARPVPLEVYKQMLAEKLLAEAPTLDTFRERWVKTTDRLSLVASLPDGGQNVRAIRQLEHLEDCDLYDVLAELGYGSEPRTRSERATIFDQRQSVWLNTMQPPTAATVRALVTLFNRNGIEELEHNNVFNTPIVQRAGGLAALKLFGKPIDILENTKRRLFAA